MITHCVCLFLCCRSGCIVQVSSINIQADVLQLLRGILVTWLPRSELIRGVLLQLPHVTPQVGSG